MKLHFLGANKQVTGSRYVLEAGGLNIMIDCGLVQERKFLHRNWEPCPFPPDKIDLLLLTHAHLDHCGLIPRFVVNGFNGPIITVEPSVELAEIVMRDSGRLHEEDAKYKKKRHQREGRKGPHPEDPLYTEQDAERAVSLLRGVQYKESIPLNKNVTAHFHQAGHILGAASIEITAKENGQTKHIVFSGDVGQWDNPLLSDPQLLNRADYAIMESTYGDRLHKDNGDIDQQLERIIKDTASKGGNILIPTFAIERAQELLYHIGNLVRENRIPNLPVFLDSPMAVDVTKVFHRHCGYLNEATRCDVARHVEALRFPGLRLTKSVEDSKAIAEIKGSAIIMAGSGMCTGGRIKHHLRANLTRPESSVLFVGYQAEGTLGRIILQGTNPVRIHGREWEVNAKLEQVHGLSAHGDREDLLKWLGGCEIPPKKLYLTHGETSAAEALAKRIRDEKGWDVDVPGYGHVADLT